MATAYLKRGSEKEALIDEVLHLRMEGHSVVLQALFGEKRRVRAKIKEIDFGSSSILLEEEDGQAR